MTIKEDQEERIHQHVVAKETTSINKAIAAFAEQLKGATPEAIEAAAKALVEATTSTADITYRGGNGERNSQMLFASHLHRFNDLASAKKARAGSCIIALLNRFATVEAVTIEMDAEFENLDDGSVFACANYFVTAEDTQDESDDEEDAIADFLNDQDLYGDVVGNREDLEQITLHVERKALSDLLIGEEVSARAVWEVVKQTTQAHLAEKQAA